MALQISWHYMYQLIEDKANNRAIDKAYFEKCLPGYTLINKLHPSIEHSDIDDVSSIDTSTLMLMSDIIISDYSSLPIEASLIDIPTIFYVYDEGTYDKVRGLNQFYKAIPDSYKVYTEERFNNDDTRKRTSIKSII